MMNTKTILAISLAAIFAISMISSAMAVESWQGIVPNTLTVSAGPKQTTLSLQATDTVPRHTSTLAGFAWFTSGNTGLALTTHNAKEFAGTHKNPARDSTQDPDGWHAHNVVLGTGTTNSAFCVTDLSDAPTVGISINGDRVTVHVRNSATAGTFVGTGATFSIQPDSDCATVGSSIPLGLKDVSFG